MKIGVVGMGSIGQRHAENARKLGHQVVSYDPAGASDYRFERLLYDDKSVDAVVVATPSLFHQGPLRAAIERGKHILIEKPISTSEGALPELLKAAASKGLVVMMGNNLRFHPCVQRAKLFVDSGSLGEPHWANFICATEWTSTAVRDGVILNTGSHEVDIALHLFGPAIVLTATTSGDVSADFVLRHDSGVRSTFHLDINTPNRVRQFWVSGAEANAWIDLDHHWIRRHLPGVPFQHWEYVATYASGYEAEMETFIARIQDQEGAKGLPGATGEEGLECLRLLLDIRKKAGL
jgi:predicted dehydrogenase